MKVSQLFLINFNFFLQMCALSQRVRMVVQTVMRKQSSAVPRARAQVR